MTDNEKPPESSAPEPLTKVASIAIPVPPTGTWTWVMGILEADGRFRYASCPILPVRDVRSAGFRHEILDPGLHALQAQLGPGPLITLN